MMEYLPAHGIDIEIIKRFKKNDTAVSASQVRRLIFLKKFDEIKELVPQSTYNFLMSKEGVQVMETIINNYDEDNLV